MSSILRSRLVWRASVIGAVVACVGAVTWVSALAAPAVTATAGVDAAGTLTVTAKGGVANRVTVSFARANFGQVVVGDAGKVAHGARCRQGGTGGLKVVCPLSAVRRVRVNLGDLGDSATVTKATWRGRRYPATIYGGTGNDHLVGGDGDDKLLGEAGLDTLDAGKGNDGLDGGDGDDHLNGGDGRDRLYGRNGHDRFDGGPKADWIDGGPGNDWLSYESRTTNLIVNLTQDGGDPKRLGGGWGGKEDQSPIPGFPGSWLADGGTGVENVDGGSGNDQLIGDGQVNSLDGGRGNDLLKGMDGPDELIGDSGHDTAGYQDRDTPVEVDLRSDNRSSGGVEDEGPGPNGSRVRDRLLTIDVVVGGAGDDVIYARNSAYEGPTEVYAGAGNDQIFLAFNGVNDKGDCGAGNDTAQADANVDPATGQMWAKDYLVACEIQDLKPTG
jgi:Ca2+-binding RTX toxin-like protein